MLTTPHTLVAAAITRLAPPIIGLPASLFSHFLLDFFIPHWNPHLYTEFSKKGKVSKNSLVIVFLDGVMALLMAGFLFLAAKTWQEKTYLTFAVFLSVLPDLVEIPYYFFKSKNGLLKKYVEIEHRLQAKASPFWGLLTQILISAASLKVIFG